MMPRVRARSRMPSSPIPRCPCPNDSRRWCFAPRAFETIRDLTRAIVDVDGALALDPTQARAWNDLGILCADAGLGDRAIDAFAHATRADANYARAWNNLGNALRNAGRPADALAAFERAVAIDGRYALAWSNLGSMQRLAGDDVNAEAALRRALSLDAGSRVATMTLAGLLHDRSDLEPAAELFLRAARLDPKDATACSELGLTLSERDDLANARSAFAEAERRDPRHAARDDRPRPRRSRWCPRARRRPRRRACLTANGLALLENDVAVRGPAACRSTAARRAALDELPARVSRRGRSSRCRCDTARSSIACWAARRRRLHARRAGLA